MQFEQENEIYLRKKLKVLIPDDGTSENEQLVATINKNLESLGYIMSQELLVALATLKESELIEFYDGLVPMLQKIRGGQRKFKPMYPNFPQQVIDMNELELYWNAIIHYIFLELPEYEELARTPLLENHKLDVIGLGNAKEFLSIFTTLLASKSSISEDNKEIVTWFVETFPHTITTLVPEDIPMKENLCFLAGLLLKYDSSIYSKLSKCIKTPTDVLRIACSFSEGDVSLAQNTIFVNLKRRERKFLLGLLESCNTSLKEEMVKYRHNWIRLGEIMHPGEFKAIYPRAFEAFQALRNDKIETFNTKVEAMLLDQNINGTVELLRSRPGEFARRLDHIFRIFNDETLNVYIAKEFLNVCDKVAVPLLLQVYQHFKNRVTESRIVFPKGQLAKVRVLENNLPEISSKFCEIFSLQIREQLVKRFSKLEPLGNVYLDEKLKNYIVHFNQRSASKALKTIVRGSKIDLDGDYDTLRFFIWWKDMNSSSNDYSRRVDVDLSAVILNNDFSYRDVVAYYNIKNFAGHHSGDITSAPNGASEFIDISLDNVRTGYIVMSINSFTKQKFVDMPECFAGWMGRKKPNSGEIYEPKTVKNKIDLASDTTICLPMMIDVEKRQVIWMDLGLKQSPRYNNVHSNTKNVSLMCKAIVNINKVSVYDLLSMHIEGRGKRVEFEEDADMKFTEDFAFEIDEIASKYL